MNSESSNETIGRGNTRCPPRSWRAALLDALGIHAILILLLVLGCALSPRFASPDNLLNVLRSVTLLGIVCAGLAFVTYSKRYADLSIPAIMAFSGLAAVSMQPYGIVVSLASGLGVGLLMGLVNGCAIGYGRVNSIVWTLAMAFLLDGLLRWFYEGRQIYPDAATGAGAFFLNLSQWELPGRFPLPTAIMLCLILAAHLLMKHTKFGTQVQLVGSSAEVAHTSGVNVPAVVMKVFVFSAFTTSVAGLLLTSMNRQATFNTGLGYDFDAVTAVVLGGVSLQGGRGSVSGVLGGVLVIGVLLNLMTLVGVESFGQMVVKGLVFVAVVGTTSYFARRSGRGEA